MIYRCFLIISLFLGTLSSVVWAQGTDDPEAALYVPQIGHGDGFETSFNFINLSNTSSRIEIRAFDESGDPLELLAQSESVLGPQTARSVVEIELAAFGSTETKTFSSTPDELLPGYACLFADGPIGVEVVFRRFADDGSLEASASVVPLPLTNAFSFIGFANEFARSGVALVNTQDEAVDVTLQLYDGLGFLIAQTMITLGPGEKIARFIDEEVFFPELMGQEFVGSVEVFADEDIGVTVIKQEGGAQAFFTTQTVQPARNIN